MIIGRNKFTYILLSSLVQVILIGTSLYFLYTSPSVGITTVWDASLKRWKVASAESWSSLKEGDVIESMGGMDIGYLHLQNMFMNLSNRYEVLAWFEAKKALYERLKEKEISITVIRDSKDNTIYIQPRKAELTFLYSPQILHLVTTSAFFIIGIIIIFKKGHNKERLVLFSFCSFTAVTGVTFTAMCLPKLSVEPHFDFLLSLINIGTFFPFASMQMLHFSLLVPKRSVVLDRAPHLPLVVYAAGILMLSTVHPNLLHVAACAMCMLILAATVHAYLACGNSVEKNQVKWIGAGYLFGLFPVVILSAIPKVLTGEFLVSPQISGASFMIIPLFMAFAIHRYRLMGIDDLLEGTLIYVATMALLVGVDIGLMSALSSRFGQNLELRPTGRIVLSLAITIALYATIRERVRLYVKKLFGREPLRELDVLAAFSDAASGQPPDSIAKLLESCIRNSFRPKSITLLAGKSGVSEEVLAGFKGRSDPVLLWESPLREKLPVEDALLALPLGRGEEADYVLFLGELPRGKLYGNHEFGILRSLLKQAKLLYENAWLFDENLQYCRTILREEKEHLLEKEKILRDLHDGIGGIMTNISLLSAIAGRQSSPASGVAGPLQTISELSQEGLSEIRTIMYSLDSTNLTWQGLIADLRSLGAKMIEPNGIGFEMESTLSDGRQSPGSLLYLNLLRIYKESLTNVVKHSGAKRVHVRLEITPEIISLCVEDDGAGIGDGASKTGRGLSHMRARAADMGAAIVVHCNGGTKVRLEMTRKP